jgi:hypothetical protein
MGGVKKGTLKVGNADYRWSVYRQPRWATRLHDSLCLLGLAILVEPLQPNRRQLILEFAIERGRHGDMPQHQRFRINDRRLAEAIQKAIEAGWDPDSRGKRFVYEAGTLQPH